MNVFARTDSELLSSVLWAQARAERLAGRIVSARNALARGSRPEYVRAILDGAEDEPAELMPRPELTRAQKTPVADGLLDFGDWEATA